MSYKKQKLEFTLDFFGGVCLDHLFSLFVFSYYVSLRYQFRVVMSVTTVTTVRIVFTSSYLRYLGLFAYSGVQHILRSYFLFFSSSCVLCRVVFSIYCTVLLVFVFVFCAQCCQFLSIVHPSLPLRCSIFRFLCSALYISVSSCVIYLLAIVLTFDLRLLIAPFWYVHTVHILKSSSFYFIQNICNNEKIQCYITRVL